MASIVKGDENLFNLIFERFNVVFGTAIRVGERIVAPNLGYLLSGAGALVTLATGTDIGPVHHVWYGSLDQRFELTAVDMRVF